MTLLSQKAPPEARTNAPNPDRAGDPASPAAEDILRQAVEQFAGKIAFATSLGLEDQVLTDMIARLGLDVPLFTLDTGRLFPETYDLLARTEQRYGRRIQVYFPDGAAVEELVRAQGVDGHRQSIAQRKACCQVRKLEPLRRALADREAWVCGLRRSQSVTRSDRRPVEWDAEFGLTKVSPLIDWTEAQVRAYLADHEVPYHPLADADYASIGCACCTRAIAPGEDVRAGRWWWESAEHKECGLHSRPDKTRS